MHLPRHKESYKIPCLLLLLITFGWAFHVNASFDPSEGLSLRRIVDFWEEGEYQIAKQEMEQFLIQFPSSDYASTICAAVGDLMLREKSYEKALHYYTQIKDAKIADQVFLNRMQSLFHMQWYATLTDECEAFLNQNQEPPKDPDLLLNVRRLLVVSIYQQCLNSAADAKLLEQLAVRAQPHFELLASIPLSEDVSQAYAHICTLLNQFEKAAQIYLDLSNRGGENKEKLLFQAALLQSKYDKTAALQTFDLLSKNSSSYAKEAAYNWLILQFELKNFEAIISVKEEALSSIPKEKWAQAHLLFGKSFLSLHEYSKAATELLLFLENKPTAESARPALLHLAEAGYQGNDVKLLDIAIQQLRNIDPKDPFLPEIVQSKVRLLKKAQEFQLAKGELDSFQQAFPLTPPLEVELMEIEFLTKEWKACHEKARHFLTTHLEHPLSLHAWRFLVSASLALGSKEELLSDLEEALQKENFLSSEERSDWEFFLAKTNFELNRLSQAEEILSTLLQKATPFSNQANANLLLAFCLRDLHENENEFCRLAEKALLNQATLIPLQEQHISLFNAYLSLSKQDPACLPIAAEHLYQAFLQKAQLQTQNLLWLAETCYTQSEADPAKTESALLVLSQILANTSCNTKTESLFIKLAKLYQKTGNHPQSIAILETMVQTYEKESDQDWGSQNEALFLLGQARHREGTLQLAEELFDRAANLSPGKRNSFSAAAALQSALLKINRKHLRTAVTALKNLMLQKRLENEPSHLESAFVYIDLLSGKAKTSKQLLKKRALLKKTKTSFEAEEDLLSKDYHAARAHFKEQDRIYSLYMQFFDAELLLTEAALSPDPAQQKELQAKAKEILLQIAGGHPPDSLLRRVEHRMIEL